MSPVAASLYWCDPYGIWGVTPTRCQLAITQGVPACAVCGGAGRAPAPLDPATLPPCPCGAPALHAGWCFHRGSFFDLHRPVDPRHRSYASLILAGVSPMEAWDRAGLPPDRKNKSRDGHEILKRPEIRNVMDTALREAGVDENRVARVLSDALGATEDHYGKDGLVGTSDDHRARLAAAKLVLDVRGQLTTKKGGGEGGGGITVRFVSSIRRNDGGDDVTAVEVKT